MPNSSTKSIHLDLSESRYHCVLDHRVGGVSLLPGSVTLELALEAVRELAVCPCEVRDVQFHEPLALSKDVSPTLHLELTTEEEGWSLSLFRERVQPLATAVIKPSDGELATSQTTSEWDVGGLLTEHQPQDFYQSLSLRGNQYGPAFQVLSELRYADGKAQGVFRSLPREDRFSIHPAHLDGAVQMVAAAANRLDGPYLLRKVGRVLVGDLSSVAHHCRSKIDAITEDSIVSGTVVIEDTGGRAMLRIEGIELVYTRGSEAVAQLALAATFTADPITETVQFWGRELGTPLACEIAPYNQVAQQLLDPVSLFRRNKSGANVILIRYADWLRDQASDFSVDTRRRDELLRERASYKLASDMEIAHLHDYETAYVHQEIFSDRCYVKHGISLDDCQCIVDVGANIGLFSLFALQQCPDARILAFEPSPEAFEALRVNAEIYGGGRLKAFNYGISDRDETAMFTFYENSSVFSTFHADLEDDESAVAAVVANMVLASLGPDASEESVRGMVDQLMLDRMRSQTLECQLRALSNVLSEEGVERIDLLKLDAEKSELKILRGIADEHWAKIRQVVIEVHDKIGTVIEEVEKLLTERGFKVEVEEETLLQGSGLYNVFGVRSASVDAGSEDQAKGDVQETVSARCAELAAQIKSTSDHLDVPLFVVSCPSPEMSGLSTESADAELEAQLAGCDGVTFLRTSDVARRYSVAAIHDAAANTLGHVPYTEDYFAALGTTISRRWYGSTSAPKKVIVLDCDNTLWRGVCGELGPDGVVIDEPYRRLQEFMLEQVEAGRLLCVCSKNETADVEAVFNARSDMPLQREHIVGWQVNWNAKSLTLRKLASELNLGLDSFIFVDDNPVECAEVAANCPEVSTILLPESPEEIPMFLEHVWDFDVTSVTDEDRKRTQLYQQQVERDRLRDQAPTLKDFINGLDLRVDIHRMNDEDIPRVAQLTQRTNQFNVSTIRRTETEVRQLGDQGIETRTVRVADRFGDYGLVGVVTYRAGPSKLMIDSMMLSCRVLGRGVEHQLLSHLGQVAQQATLAELAIEFRSSERNQPALNFLESLDASCHQLGDRIEFHIPAESAAAARYQPTDKIAEDTNDTVDSNASRNIAVRNAVSATKWRTAAGILKAAKDQHVRPRPATLHTLVPPAGETESTVAQIWQDVLRVERVGATDSFQELGGTSLLAVQLVARLQDKLQSDISIVSIFEYPTVRQLAAHITGNQDGTKSSQDSTDGAKERAMRRRNAQGRRRSR